MLGIFTLTAFSANAQIGKGSVQIGANLGFTVTNTDQNQVGQTALLGSGSTSSLVISPSAGYFLANNFVLGIAGGDTRTETNNSNTNPAGYTNTSSVISNSFSIGPYARYYFKLGEKAAVFTQLSLAYASNSGSTATTNNNPIDVGSTLSTSSGQSLTITLQPGFSYFISNRFTLEAMIGSFYYAGTTSTNTPDPSNATQNAALTTNTSKLNFNLTSTSVLFGFKYYIRKT